MKYLNSLEAYYAVGGQNEIREDSGYGVVVSGDSRPAGAEEFFDRYPEYAPQ